MKQTHVLTQELLKSILHYDPYTGVFVWRKTRGPAKAGNVAGTLFYSGRRVYRRIFIFGKSHLSHRLAWLYMFGKFPDEDIDHINGDGLNNKIENIRSVSRQENSRNAGLNSDNKSNHCGVVWHKREKRWRAQIKVNYRIKSLGSFDSIDEAVAVRKEAEKEYGFHSNHGKTRYLFTRGQKAP